MIRSNFELVNFFINIRRLFQKQQNASMHAKHKCNQLICHWHGIEGEKMNFKKLAVESCIEKCQKEIIIKKATMEDCQNKNELIWYLIFSKIFAMLILHSQVILHIVSHHFWPTHWPATVSGYDNNWFRKNQSAYSSFQEKPQGCLQRNSS